MENEERSVKPWDLLNKNKPRSPEDLQQLRMSICKSCEFFVSFTQQCKKCGCIMPAKTRLAEASCPMHKWEAVKE